MDKFEKEFEELRQLEEELTAMIKLNADEDIIEKQKEKIRRKEKKILKSSNEELKRRV